MQRRSKTSGIFAISLAGLVAGGLGGCADGVELQGGVFDLLGVSGTALTGKKAETQKVAARPGLVLPPNTERLPVPGEDNSVGDTVAWPSDPDQRRKVDRATLERQQKDVCEKAALEEKARPTGIPASGPLGTCTPSALRGMFGSNNPLDKL